MNGYISMEVWPPRNAEEDAKFIQTLNVTQHLNPPFISVTVSDRRPAELTRQTAICIQREWGMVAMPHLRCLGRTEHEFCREIEGLVEHGIRRVLVVRGDRSPSSLESAHGTLRFAFEGVALIRKIGAPLTVAVGCHPDVHEEALDAGTDLHHLKAKVDAGADFVISQAFFEASIWSTFVERARQIGISVPLLPGVLPLYGPTQANALTRMSRARIPHALATSFAGACGEQAERKIGRTHTLTLCRELPAFHLFTFNRPDAIHWLTG